MLIGLGDGVRRSTSSRRSSSSTRVNVLLNYVLSWSLVLFVIVFQNDIRRALTQVGTGPLFSPRDRVAQGQVVEEIVTRGRRTWPAGASAR